MSNFSDSLCSDDSNIFDTFSPSPNSHRSTSPPLEECQDDLVLKRRTLPLELVEYIVDLFYRCYRSFRALRALSVASSQFRLIVLQRYMTCLEVQSAKYLSSLLDMHRSMLSRCTAAWRCLGFYWVKSLTAHSGALASASWRPSLMLSLRSLRISFAAEAKSTQEIRAKQIFDIPLANSPMVYLTSLTLTELWRIDASLLNTVARGFPGLMSLHLSCSENLDVSCCWACFEQSSSAVDHSPIPNQFLTVASLASVFAKALRPLTKLTDLHLGIFLSDEEILERHINHYDNPRAYSRVARNAFGQSYHLTRQGTVLSQSESPSSVHLDRVSYTEDGEDRIDLMAAQNMTFDNLPPFPHGPELCPICSIAFFTSDVRTRELEASLALALKLKSLKTITWSSFFARKLHSEDERKTGDWQRTTKTYVLRHGGRVRIRRRPWD